MSVHDVSKVPTIFFSRNTLDSINFYLSKKKKKKRFYQITNTKHFLYLIRNVVFSFLLFFILILTFLCRLAVAIYKKKFSLLFFFSFLFFNAVGLFLLNGF